MKEISLKMLDELAKKMPVIDETDQKRYAGGAYYIDYDGMEFGQVGSSDHLYLLGTKQMYDYAVANRLEDYGLDLYSATDDSFLPIDVYYGKHVQKNIFAAYARSLIGYEGAISIVNDSNKDDLYYVRSEQPGVSGALCFNRGNSGMIFNHNGLINRLFQVEREMHETPSYPGGGDLNDPGGDPRIMAIMFAIQELDKEDAQAASELTDPHSHIHDYGKYAIIYNQNQEMRKSYASQLCVIWNEQGHAGYGYGLEVANGICGVKPLDKYPDGSKS